jgi:hypothetical protein
MPTQPFLPLRLPPTSYLRRGAAGGSHPHLSHPHPPHDRPRHRRLLHCSDKPIYCPYCGSNSQTVAHVIKHSLHFAIARATHLRPAARDLSFATLFGTKEGGNALIRFLEVIRACFRPRDEMFMSPMGPDATIYLRLPHCPLVLP